MAALLNGPEIRALETLYASAMRQGVDRGELDDAREVIDLLRSGRALERVLKPMIDDLGRDAESINRSVFELKQGVPRETARGRITGIEQARNRIMRDNVVTVG